MRNQHKNYNDALGNYCVYEIAVFDKTYKIGKADLDRITLSSGTPTRIHQQIRNLRRKHGSENVIFDILDRFFGITTKQAKAFEKAVLDYIYLRDGIVPAGNLKSYKPE